MAAWKGYKDVVELLLSHSAEVDAKTNHRSTSLLLDGSTAPLLAAQNGHKEKGRKVNEMKMKKFS